MPDFLVTPYPYIFLPFFSQNLDQCFFEFPIFIAPQPTEFLRRGDAMRNQPIRHAFQRIAPLRFSQIRLDAGPDLAEMRTI